MARLEQGGTPIRTAEDVAKIRYPAEQQFALLLLAIISKKPYLRLRYEQVEFTLERENGTIASTVPDFSIHNVRTGREYHLEVTCAERCRHDFKDRQKEVMLSNGVQYTILWRENLEKLQKRHPEHDLLKPIKSKPPPFNSRKTLL